jgi:hypothetical protein
LCEYFALLIFFFDTFFSKTCNTAGLRPVKKLENLPAYGRAGYKACNSTGLRVVKLDKIN